jgi:hypothetical protein
MIVAGQTRTAEGNQSVKDVLFSVCRNKKRTKVLSGVSECDRKLLDMTTHGPEGDEALIM